MKQVLSVEEGCIILITGRKGTGKLKIARAIRQVCEDKNIPCIIYNENTTAEDIIHQINSYEKLPFVLIAILNGTPVNNPEYKNLLEACHIHIKTKNDLSANPTIKLNNLSVFLWA